MSGPKRGIWYVPYDPTPTRLADLRRFAAKQDAWLQRHGSFIAFYLGNATLEKARVARNMIDPYITERNPDRGFDAYGSAWTLFNQLYREAIQVQKQQEQQRLQERLRREKAAHRLVSECRLLWQDKANQVLLQRWIRRADLARLAESLSQAGVGGYTSMRKKARAWKADFENLIAQATRCAERNSKAIREYLPCVSDAIRNLTDLNVEALTEEERRHFEIQKDGLVQAIQDALSRENMPALKSTYSQVNALEKDYRSKIIKAEFDKASAAVREALLKSGYSIGTRKEADGTVVFQASGFPFKSVNVEMNPNSRQMKLNVSDERGTHCVQDVQSLQTELARQGMKLKITDWGKGKPQTVRENLQQRLNM